ncbi:MAG: universal stress protein [Chloroflexi bacterium]|nr:universal stress protein [Chloroflexota bacterium]
MKTEFLICTNGNEGTWPAIEYGAWAAALLDAPVTLLGIAEHLPSAPIDDKYPLEEIFARAVELFQQKGIDYSLEIQNGNAEDVVPHIAKPKDCITVVGPLGRPPVRRLLVRRSIHHLMAEITTPILYVPQARIPLKRMLVCLGGLGYEITAEHLAVRVAVLSKAEVTLLHVAPPVDLNYPTARAEREQWRDLANTNTLPGRNIRQALETARVAGLTASVKARQGNIVEEILAEIKERNYDLVCMGSQYSAHGLRQMYATNVTDEVAESAQCPILTARYMPEQKP